MINKEKLATISFPHKYEKNQLKTRIGISPILSKVRSLLSGFMSTIYAN